MKYLSVMTTEEKSLTNGGFRLSTCGTIVKTEPIWDSLLLKHLRHHAQMSEVMKPIPRLFKISRCR